jgi:hypothetical protein
VIDGDEHPLDAGHLVAVDAGTERILRSGPTGLRVLCIGGVPRGVYERPAWASVGTRSHPDGSTPTANEGDTPT